MREKLAADVEDEVKEEAILLVGEEKLEGKSGVTWDEVTCRRCLVGSSHW